MRKFIVYPFIVCVGLSPLWIACSKEEMQTPVCVPTNLVYANGDSVVYHYGASGEFTGLSYYTLFDVPTMTERFRVVNNASKLPEEITKLVVLADGSEAFSIAYEINYDESNRPSSIITYYTPDKTFAHEEEVFTYDGSGRLVVREYTTGVDSRWEYEYTSDGNLAKAYFVNAYFGRVLAWENHSSDKNPTFYSGSPGLALVNTYVFNHYPWKNNPVSSTVLFQRNILYNPPQGREVTFTMAYTDKGWPRIISNTAPDILAEIRTINYSCK